ncbi:[citrate (pro-3S)-lyase] ligase [Ursidibacter sp. B-7004-1]
MLFQRVDILNKDNSYLSEIKQFLHKNELTFDEQILSFILAYNENDELIACGGIAPRIIKCVAIDESYRGEGIALKLATELIHLAYELSYPDLFIYTKPEYENVFKVCGFHTLVTAYPHMVLLENSTTRLKKECYKWQSMRVEGEKIGAIVMNANPFTLGHRYLIEQALAQCDHLHLFIVGENASLFNYQTRFQLVKQGIADLSNITLHEGSDYIISRATFPNYFLKDKGLTDELYVEIDLKLFRQYIAPALNITHRFVGSEPFCAVTREYNRQMHQWLEQSEMAFPSISVIEIARKDYQDLPISASAVRSLLAEQEWEMIAYLVPTTTFSFLQEQYGNSPL